MFLNQTTPLDFKDVVLGPVRVLKNYAREDIIICLYEENAIANKPEIDVLSTRMDKDISLFPVGEIVYRVWRNVVLVSVEERLAHASGDESPEENLTFFRAH